MTPARALKSQRPDARGTAIVSLSMISCLGGFRTLAAKACGCFRACGRPDALGFAAVLWSTLPYAENVGSQFHSLRQNFLHHHSSPFEKPRHKADFIGLMALDTFATIRHNPDDDCGRDCGQLGYGIHDAHRKTDRRDVNPTV